MLVKRVLVSLVLVPFGVAIIALGGIAYTLTLTLILGLAAWEYGRLFHPGVDCPSPWLVILGTVVICVSRAFFTNEITLGLFALLILLAMGVHLIQFERGFNRSATGFAITLSGFVYLGWVGSYLISLRSLPDGSWWVLTVLPTVWLADAGAMFVGMRYGKHLMTPRLSPRKTWEGYFGGVVCGVLAGALLVYLWGFFTPFIAVWKGALIGLLLSVLTPLGDLGESMFKRQAGVKDSGSLLPGHGGIFDRIDSWLWAAVIGYYFATIIT